MLRLTLIGVLSAVCPKLGLRYFLSLQRGSNDPCNRDGAGADRDDADDESSNVNGPAADIVYGKLRHYFGTFPTYFCIY